MSTAQYVGGIFSGVGQVFTMMPFQLVKVRLQSDSKTNPKYNSMLDCIKKIAKQQGPLAFYKGTMVPLFGLSLISGLQFGVNKTTQKLFQNKKKPNGQLPTIYCFLSGMIAGFITGTFTCPVELARIKVQIPQPGNLYKSSTHALSSIFKQRGIVGNYKGFVPTLLRQVPGYAVYFATYQKLIFNSPKQTQFQRFFFPLINGGLAGLTFWTAIYPFDVVKSMIQIDSAKNPTIFGFFDGVKKVYNGNIGNFYKGYLVVALRAIPVNAVGFLFYQYGKRIFLYSTNK